jgi:hypothetical protein
MVFVGGIMSRSREEFQKEALKSRSSFVSELVGFIANTKKWWLLPIVVCMILLALLVFFSGSGAAPFIYTIF